MVKHVWSGAAYFWLLSLAPAVAQSLSSVSVIRRVPAPETGVGLLGLAMVGTAAFLAYRRRRGRNGL